MVSKAYNILLCTDCIYKLIIMCNQATSNQSYFIRSLTPSDDECIKLTYLQVGVLINETMV